MQDEPFSLYTNKTLYDEFYVKVYDNILHDSFKNHYEIEEMRKRAKITKKSHVLDIGCGPGHHLKLLKEDGIKVIGLETSKAMIKKCKSRDQEVKYGNAMDALVFEADLFTHIMCLFYTFYYMPNQEDFLRNCNKWLRFNGYLLVHIVDKDKFHPIIPAGEIFTMPTQNLAKEGERITESVVIFNDFKYIAKYGEINSTTSSFNETFTFKNGDVRKNEHKMKMLNIPAYEKMFKRTGFEIAGKINLASARYFNQFIYILKKTN